MSAEPVLSADGLWKQFQTPEGTLDVLRGVDLRLERSEIVAVVGASGVGKSTLLHVLGGLEPPTRGSVRVSGQDLWLMGDRMLAQCRNSMIGFVFQFHHLLREFSACENVMMPILLGGKGKEEAARRARNLLEEMGLGERLSHMPATLSGGEAQRVAVARALACDPPVILADEPSGNLDRAHSEDLHHLIWRIRHEMGHAFLIATHDMDLAQRADRVLEIRDGLAWPLRKELMGENAPGPARPAPRRNG